jgi:hypothetical protein
MKPAHVRLIGLMAGIVVLTSCQKPLRLLLFNGTAEEAIVEVNGRGRSSGSYKLPPSKSVELPRLGQLAVRLGTNTWEYPDFETLPVGLVERRWNKDRLKVQLQDNGSILVLAASTTSPVTNFPPQPPGFPLRPSRKP